MIIRSAHPAPVLGRGPLQDLVLGRARDLPGKLALVDTRSGTQFTFGELKASIHRVAGGLAAQGFTSGDVFAIACANCAEFVLAFHAVGLLGGTVTTLNPAYTTEEMANQLSDSGATWLLADAAILPKALEAAAAAGIQRVFATGGADLSAAEVFGTLDSGSRTVPSVALDPATHLMALPYSSGTLGLPKGVMLTHDNLSVNVLQSAVCGLKEDDVILGILPLFHIFGMNVMMNTGLSIGATLVLLPRFDLEEFLGAVQHYKATYVFLVPPILLALAKHPLVDQFDLSSLRCLLSGAAPLGEAVARQVEERLGCVVLQGYGLTETSPVAMVSAKDGSMPRASAGVPVAGTEARVVHLETGDPVEEGERGELWIRGPQVMKGYLNRPEATAEAIDPEGWFRTGDIARVDAAGHIYIVDRLKELIKVNGMQVAPAELEALLLSHPSIADAAVIPIHDDKSGERPKAFIVLKPGESQDAEAIMAYAAGRVAPHKRITAVEFTAQIPKSPSGKILRRILVEQEREKPAT